MKQILNSFRVFMACVFTISLFFISCQEENTQVAEPSKPLLATMSTYREDGTLEETESYRYDTSRRLVEMTNNNGRKAVLEYSPSTVTVKEYEKDVLVYAAACALNDQSLCISFVPDEDQKTIYTYDANGYRTKMVDQFKSSTFTETYTVSNQNYVTITYQDVYVMEESARVKDQGLIGTLQQLKTFKRAITSQNILKSATEVIDNYKTDFQFYTDKVNTIDMENKGISFFGKQNKNPVMQETETSDDRPAYTTTYSYAYDSKGRISRKIYQSGKYDVFTYVE